MTKDSSQLRYKHPTLCYPISSLREISDPGSVFRRAIFLAHSQSRQIDDETNYEKLF